jgi:metal-dependent amidase/aminoacylase/carboxypeptidase family protein
MQACGHDFHMTSLLASAELLLKVKDKWSGTLILCFQPAEEKGAGAQAMVDDGLYDKVPLPDIVLGGHVMPYKTGKLNWSCKGILRMHRYDSNSHAGVLKASNGFKISHLHHIDSKIFAASICYIGR